MWNQVKDFFNELSEIEEIIFIKLKAEFDSKLKINKKEYNNELYNIKQWFFKLYYSTDKALDLLKNELKWLKNKEKIKDWIRSIIYKDRFKIFELKHENNNLIKLLNEVSDNSENIIEKNKELLKYVKELEKWYTYQQLNMIKQNINNDY